MKINTNGNIYTIIYSIIVVVVVAVLLTIASTALKPAQMRNIEIEKKENILKAVNKATGIKSAKNKAEYVETEYNKYIVDSYLVDINGNKKQGDAFNTELKTELIKPESERSLPVFICKDGDKTEYVLPLRGKGLWGPIWGYIALESDFNTVAGATFDHEGETPGLGAEITTQHFTSQFCGKKIYKDGKMVYIKIQKPGPPTDDNTVDGISGGTITSRGVQSMIASNLKDYSAFFSKMKEGKTTNRKYENN